MKRSCVIAPFLILAACNGTPDAGAGSALSMDSIAPLPGDTAEATAPDPQAARGLVITSNGIGLVRRGMSVQDVRGALTPSQSLASSDAAFMVDIVALPVVTDRDTLYRLVFPAGEEPDEEARPHFVVTEHPRARTADGVGPGTTLDRAARIYGEPTLSYSIHDESREYATFPRQPEHVRFRVRPVSDDAHFAGTYATTDEYNTTVTYDPDARIWMVFVDLRTGMQ